MRLSDRIGRRMKLHDLHVFMAVAQAGSMGKAAGLLNTTQPAISKSIAELERAVGARLLDRSRKGVEPTQHGRALLKRGTVAFDELRQGVRDIEYLSEPGTGELKIGTSPSLSEGVGFAVLEQLSRKYPRLSIQIVLGGTMALFEELRERRIDLGFLRMAGRTPPEDMDQEVLFEDPLVVIVGADSPWARRRRIKLADLVDEPWTWSSPGTMFDNLVVGAFRADGLSPPRATIHAESINLKIKLAATGRFLAIVPAAALKCTATRGLIKVLPVELPTTRQPSGLITMKNRTLSPPAQLFIQCARQVTKPLANSLWTA